MPLTQLCLMNYRPVVTICNFRPDLFYGKPSRLYFCYTMEYSKTYTVKDEHIDVQNIVDGLYYPFYMEWCRHDFVREVLGFDFEEEAHKGNNMVLSRYTLQFVRSLKKGDTFQVTCSPMLDKSNKAVLHFRQTIMLNNKVVTKAVFSGTCVKAGGGRPFLPEGLLTKLTDAPEWDGEL